MISGCEVKNAKELHPRRHPSPLHWNEIFLLDSHAFKREEGGGGGVAVGDYPSRAIQPSSAVR